MTTRKTLFSILLIPVFLSACKPSGPPTLSKTTMNSPDPLTVRTATNFDVCEPTSQTCVDAGQALTDLATAEELTKIDNLELTKTGDLIAVIASIRYVDNKDLYAIFLTQATPPNSTCHACAPHIGVAVYQFHNSWKLFAKNSTVKDIGSWGKISDGTPVLNVLPVSTENFLITITDEYNNQGTMRNMHFIDVGTVDATLNRRVNYLDSVVVSTQDCSGTSPGEDWTSDLQVNSHVYPPKITQIRKYYSKICSDDKTVAYQKTVNYEFEYGKFHAQTK